MVAELHVQACLLCEVEILQQILQLICSVLPLPRRHKNLHNTI